MIRHVVSNDRGAAAGLAAHDELVSLDGYRVTATNWPVLLERVRVGRPVEICVFRRDELRRFTIEPAVPPRDTCFLSLETDVEAVVSRRRQDWLGA
jgi:predicted metalloprotease with PDZ domain